MCYTWDVKGLKLRAKRGRACFSGQAIRPRVSDFERKVNGAAVFLDSAAIRRIRAPLMRRWGGLHPQYANVHRGYTPARRPPKLTRGALIKLARFHQRARSRRGDLFPQRHGSLNCRVYWGLTHIHAGDRIVITRWNSRQPGAWQQ
jgi:hypothetical protein